VDDPNLEGPIHDAPNLGHRSPCVLVFVVQPIEPLLNFKWFDVVRDLIAPRANENIANAHGSHSDCGKHREMRFGRRPPIFSIAKNPSGNTKESAQCGMTRHSNAAESPALDRAFAEPAPINWEGAIIMGAAPKNGGDRDRLLQTSIIRHQNSIFLSPRLALRLFLDLQSGRVLPCYANGPSLARMIGRYSATVG
jgi:hypothetical protein